MRPVLLCDNGSKRAASVLSLRAAATALAALLGGEAVLPVSLKYSAVRRRRRRRAGALCRRSWRRWRRAASAAP